MPEIYAIVSEQKAYLRRLIGYKKVGPDGVTRTFSLAFALGCDHYVNGASVLCAKCGKVYRCRRCHNEDEDHAFSFAALVCEFCGKHQAFGLKCSGCAQSFGLYACEKCHLIIGISAEYVTFRHCDKCNVCVTGTDVRHCDRCCKCFVGRHFDAHRCGFVFEGDCPVCLTPLQKYGARQLYCGHCIHINCFASTGRPNCPLCQKIALVGRKRAHFMQKEQVKSQLFAIGVRNCQAYCRECETTFCAETSVNLGTFCPQCRTFNVQVVGELSSKAEVRGWVLRRGDNDDELLEFMRRVMGPTAVFAQLQQAMRAEISVHQRLVVVEIANKALRRQLLE